MSERTRLSLRCGPVQGSQEGDVLLWRGIPYARPPVGDLRWRSPEPATPWTSTLSAVAHRDQAVQPEDPFADRTGTIGSSEDCLHLSVCAPAARPPADGWPVLFVVHGGGFLTGNGHMLGEGQAFARAGIVVVTFNYRLGALGFCDLGGLFGAADADAVNCGLLDQLAALQWVQDNIADFGANPGRVTIYGSSAGAKSVAALMAAPAAAGRYAQAISSSGGAEHVHDADSAVALASRLMAELDCRDARQARGLPAGEILAAQNRILAPSRATWLWRPAIQPGVLPGVPLGLIESGSAAGVPLLAGANGNEAASFAYLLGAQALTANCAQVLAPLLAGHGYQGTADGESRYRALLQTYRRSRGLSDDVAAMIAAIGDERYAVPTERLADAQACHAPVFRYRVDIASPGWPPELAGGHGCELGMIWRVRESWARAAGGSTRAGDFLHAAWVAFVRDGKPASEPLLWPHYDPSERAVMIVDDAPHLEHDPRREERLAWADVRWQPGSWFDWTP